MYRTIHSYTLLPWLARNGPYSRHNSAKYVSHWGMSIPYTKQKSSSLLAKPVPHYCYYTRPPCGLKKSNNIIHVSGIVGQAWVSEMFQLTACWSGDCLLFCSCIAKSSYDSLVQSKNLVHFIQVFHFLVRHIKMGWSFFSLSHLSPFSVLLIPLYCSTVLLCKTLWQYILLALNFACISAFLLLTPHRTFIPTENRLICTREPWGNDCWIEWQTRIILSHMIGLYCIDLA